MSNGVGRHTLNLRRQRFAWNSTGLESSINNIDFYCSTEFPGSVPEQLIDITGGKDVLTQL